MCIRMYTYIYISLISLTVLSWSVRSNCSFLHGIYASSVAGGTFAFGGGSVLSKTGETCKPCENSSRTWFPRCTYSATEAEFLC